VQLRLQRNCEQWNRRLRLRQHGLGLSELTVGSNTGIPALLHEFDEMLVGGDLIFSKVQASLRTAYLHVRISGFRGHCDAGSRAGRLGSLGFGSSGFSSPFQTAEQIGFPTRHESE